MPRQGNHLAVVVDEYCGAVGLVTIADLLEEIVGEITAGEWWGAVITGRSAGSFLGTQGDVWDTQEDMLNCFIGSIVSLLLLTRMHNRQLAHLGVDKVKK